MIFKLYSICLNLRHNFNWLDSFMELNDKYDWNITIIKPVSVAQRTQGPIYRVFHTHVAMWNILKYLLNQCTLITLYYLSLYFMSLSTIVHFIHDTKWSGLCICIERRGEIAGWCMMPNDSGYYIKIKVISIMWYLLNQFGPRCQHLDW